MILITLDRNMFTSLYVVTFSVCYNMSIVGTGERLYLKIYEHIPKGLSRNLSKVRSSSFARQWVKFVSRSRKAFWAIGWQKSGRLLRLLKAAAVRHHKHNLPKQLDFVSTSVLFSQQMWGQDVRWLQLIITFQIQVTSVILFLFIDLLLCAAFRDRRTVNFQNQPSCESAIHIYMRNKC